jgi:hypothetical protein
MTDIVAMKELIELRLKRNEMNLRILSLYDSLWSIAVPTSPELIISVITQFGDSLREAGGVVMGGSIIYLINPFESSVPYDIDVWLPDGKTWAPDGEWCMSTSFDIKDYGDSSLNPNIRHITNYRNHLYHFTIQVIETKLSSAVDMASTFDLDICQAIWSPQIDPDTQKPLGIKATRPSIIDAIMKREATFRHHDMDVHRLDGEGICVKQRAYVRLRKYSDRGYKIFLHPESAFLRSRIRLTAQSGSSYVSYNPSVRSSTKSE